MYRTLTNILSHLLNISEHVLSPCPCCLLGLSGHSSTVFLRVQLTDTLLSSADAQATSFVSRPHTVILSKLAATQITVEYDTLLIRPTDLCVVSSSAVSALKPSNKINQSVSVKIDQSDCLLLVGHCARCKNRCEALYSVVAMASLPARQTDHSSSRNPLCVLFKPLVVDDLPLPPSSPSPDLPSIIHHHSSSSRVLCWHDNQL